MSCNPPHQSGDGKLGIGHLMNSRGSTTLTNFTTPCQRVRESVTARLELKLRNVRFRFDWCQPSWRDEHPGRNDCDRCKNLGSINAEHQSRIHVENPCRESMRNPRIRFLVSCESPLFGNRIPPPPAGSLCASSGYHVQSCSLIEVFRSKALTAHCSLLTARRPSGTSPLVPEGFGPPHSKLVKTPGLTNTP